MVDSKPGFIAILWGMSMPADPQRVNFQKLSKILYDKYKKFPFVNRTRILMRAFALYQMGSGSLREERKTIRRYKLKCSCMQTFVQSNVSAS